MTLPTVVVRVATRDRETLQIIETALDQRVPVALLHEKLSADEHARQRAELAAADYEADDAVILFTSGSTGTPRGVVLSRTSIDGAAAACWEHLGRLDGDRWPATLPLAHAGGLSVIVRCRAAGLARTFDANEATILSMVPAQLAELLADPAWHPSPLLRAVLLGGAPAPRSLVDAAIERGVPVLETYGMTETFGQIATARVPGGPLVPLPGVTIEGGTREAPAPLRVRGPMLATRYLDGALIAPELVTSDLGFVEDGIVHVVGRADDMILSGGENVHPAQVERVLAATPGVRAAAVFGVADPEWGQLVAAALVVDSTFDAPSARARWHAALPPFARPRRLAVVDAIPLVPSGKVDRRALATLPTSPIAYG